MSRSPASILYDSSGNAVGVTFDGGVYRLEMIGKVRNSSGTLVNPATEDTLATRATEATLASLDGKDFATETTLDAFSTAFSATDFATETTLASCDSSLSSIDTSIDVSLSTRASEATLSAADTKLGTIDAVLDSIKDTDGIKKITDPLPAGTNQIGAVSQGTKGAGTNAWPVVLYDSAGNAVTVTQQTGGVRRLEVTGAVAVTGSTPPPSTNPFVVRADTPLTVGVNTQSLVIPSGQTFYLQSLLAGNEDPTKGAVVEVFYNNGTQRLVTRVYIAGQTQLYSYADVNTARDGTVMVGNGTNTIQVRRAKYSGSNIAIDAVLRGYTV